MLCVIFKCRKGMGNFMNKIVVVMAGVFFAQVSFADTVSVCFSRSSARLEGLDKVVVTESDGGFVDVRNPNHVSPEVMLRGTYPDNEPTKPVTEELGLDGWADIQNPNTVTGLSIKYSYSRENDQWSSISQVTVREGNRVEVYGACKVVTQQ